MQEAWVRSLGWKDFLEKGRATHSSILARENPWTEEPGGLQSIGSHRVWHDWVTNTSFKWLNKAHLHYGGQSALIRVQIAMLISSKNTFMETSRVVFDQIAESCSLAKLTYKINHSSRPFGFHSEDLGTHWKGFNRGKTWSYLILLLFL